MLRRQKDIQAREPAFNRREDQLVAAHLIQRICVNLNSIFRAASMLARISRLSPCAADPG
jgi:hypothetical protein